MKTIFQIAILGLAIIFTPSPCFALRSIGFLNKEQAQEKGILISASPSGPNAAWIEIELTPGEKLKDYHHTELEINEGDKMLMAYTGLKEERTNSGKILIRLMINRVFLEKVSLCVVAGLDAGYTLRLTDFVDVKKLD